MSLWSEHALPYLIEKAGRSRGILAQRRRWIPEARGEILEIGVGSGLNLPFYDPARARQVIAIDPSAAVRRRARSRGAAASVPVALMGGDAEALAFASARFDTVVMTYTLCSVRDPARALAEIRRVLRPDGALIVVEHGIARAPATRAWQRRITPAWRRVAGNCHLDRDVVALLAAAGFATDAIAAHETADARLAVTSFAYEGIARMT